MLDKVDITEISILSGCSRLLAPVTCKAEVDLPDHAAQESQIKVPSEGG